MLYDNKDSEKLVVILPYFNVKTNLDEQGDI